MYSILVVDDEMIEREGVTFLLEKYQYPFRVFTKRNGKEALEFLRDTSVDVLCTDIKMPFMDGLELCEAAKALDPGLHIVMLTAYNDFEYTKRAIKVKVDDYLMKPVFVDRFRDCMDQIIANLDRQKAERDRKQRLVQAYKTGDAVMRNAAIEHIMRELETQYAGTDSGDESDVRNVVRLAVEMIRKEYMTPLTLDDVAGRVSLSKGRLSTLFKADTGFSVGQYITLARMQKARELVCATNIKLNDISRMVGYENPSYFCELFKRTYGVTAIHLRNGQEDA